MREITKTIRAHKSFGLYKYSGLLDESIDKIDGKLIKSTHIIEYGESSSLGYFGNY